MTNSYSVCLICREPLAGAGNVHQSCYDRVDAKLAGGNDGAE